MKPPMPPKLPFLSSSHDPPFIYLLLKTPALLTGSPQCSLNTRGSCVQNALSKIKNADEIAALARLWRGASRLAMTALCKAFCTPGSDKGADELYHNPRVRNANVNRGGCLR